MERVNPENLKIEYRKGIIPNGPIIPRRYTLTQTDNDIFFLTVALYYAYDQLNNNRGGIKGEWEQENNQYLYKVKINMDQEVGLLKSFVKKQVLVRKLSRALEAIYYANQELFQSHPVLKNSSIYVEYESSFNENNPVEYRGDFIDYG